MFSARGRLARPLKIFSFPWVLDWPVTAASMSDPPPADLRAHLALALVPNLGPARTAALLRHFGSPAAVLTATAAQLRGVPQIGEKLADAFAAAFRTADVDAELRRIEQHGVR